MKAKVKTTGEIIEVEDFGNGAYGRIDGPVAIYTKRSLDFNISTPEKVVIEGWICRDEDGTLCLYYKKPMRGAEEWCGNYDRQLPEESFPLITWESKPQRVKIEITLIDEKDEKG